MLTTHFDRTAKAGGRIAWAVKGLAIGRVWVVEGGEATISRLERIF
jgi:hypothetical protein